MQTHHPDHTQQTGHPIVIGGCVAGLLAAELQATQFGATPLTLAKRGEEATMQRNRVLKFPQWIGVALVWAALFLGLFGLRPSMIFAAENNAADTIVITWTAAGGFSPAAVDIQRGETVIWRNQDTVPLALRSGLANAVYLPMIAANTDMARAAEVQSAAAQQSAVLPTIDTVINPGQEYSLRFTSAGLFHFFDASQSGGMGTVNIAESLAAPISCTPGAPGNGAADGELPGVMYATSADRTLLRWFWSDCATASFQIFRSENGGSETLIATVTPETDPIAAEDLLNSIDPRWPDLSSRAMALILQDGDFSQDVTKTEIADLFSFLYNNGLAGVHMTNQYYPLALMLGWGYLDTDITPGVNYTYRVAAEGGDLGMVTVAAGQRTPLIAPTGVITDDLDIESWDGNWGRFQRNRRYDGQIYLSWDLENPVQDQGAMIIGYDVFEATAVNELNQIVTAQKIVDANVAEDGDAIVVPGPVAAADGVDYLFRYAPGDYAARTLCVAPRDLLNQPVRWPEDAHQCSAPIVVAAADYLPPVAPHNIAAVAVDNSTQVNLTWEHVNGRDVARFVIQRTHDMNCEVGACWTDVATIAAADRAWSDMAAPCQNDPLDPEGCWYRVIAADDAGNRSAPSKAVYALIYDTLPPSQLEIESAPCKNPADPDNSQCVDIFTDAVSIRLNCRFHPDLRADEIYLTNIDAEDFVGLDWVATIKSIYQPPLHLHEVSCRLILEDEYGNLSDIDNSPVIAVDLDSDNADQLTQPIITGIESVFVGAGDWDATVHWDMADHPMLGGFVIQRQDRTGAQNFVGIAAAARSFTDVSVQQGEVYTYVVQAQPIHGGVNATESEPRAHRVLPGEDRPLVVLNWAQMSPSWNAETATSSLLVEAGSVAPDGIIHYAVFRSLHADRDFVQITPILETTGSAIFYQDDSAQRGCYYYVLVTFRTRDGEPTGYTEARQPGACNQPGPIYTPGPAADAPAYPLANCVAAVQPDAPLVNFRFGGGFEVAVEGINEGAYGPENVSGGGWLLLQTAEETIPVPMSFSGLTVNAEGYVCSGTAAVDLSTMPGGGLWLQTPGGWPYQLIGVTLQPWFGSNNTASATLDIFTGDAFTVGANVGDMSQRLRIADARITHSLRFSRTFLSMGQPQQCGHPTLAFRLETLPMEIFPTGTVQINESQITLSSACTRYVDRYNDGFPMITSPYSGLKDHRFANEQFLNVGMTAGAVTITPSGVDGSFSTAADVRWYASYPFAFHVMVDGLTVNLADSQIVGGSTGAGTVSVLYHQTADNGKQGTVSGSFAGLVIGPRGDMTTSLTLGGVDWDAFAIPAAGWDFYQGALTTPGLPAIHDGGVARSIMWRSHPSNVTTVAIPDGVLPGEMEPGFNRRSTGATLAWANCGDIAVFDNVSMDSYLRRSGVTQRHIPLYSEGAQMTVHGYPFRPQRFDLHFMDNALLETNIEGFVHLPFPSNVDVRLVDIWLTGNVNDPGAGDMACIGGGRIPDGEQDHTLDYWDVDTRFETAEFRQELGGDTILWFQGDIRNLVHLTTNDGDAVLPAELAFDPDGNFHDDPRNGPKYDRGDYRFQRFPYLMERLRLSDWASGAGETPVWNADATTIDAPSAGTWNSNGFVGLRGVPVAPYFGPLFIDQEMADGDQIVMAAWDETVTGFAAQPRVSKEWVKVARVRITFDYDHLVHVYDAAGDAGLFVGFKDYRFVPDRYLEFPGIPDPVEEINIIAEQKEKLKRLQVIQLDTGTVISPTATGVYLGLSAGVAPLRAIAEARGVDGVGEMGAWADKMRINATAKPVYIQQMQILADNVGNFTFEETTSALDQLSDADIENLLDVQNVGGRTQGLLAEKGINIHRLRGLVEVEGEGLQTQFSRFHLSTQIEIKGREQNPDAPVEIPDNPAVQEEPPLFYAERVTLSIVRHGDTTIVGKGIESSKFEDKLDSFDATLVINSTKPQFEGGLTLWGLKSGGVSMDNASAVMGIGAETNYMGISFDGEFGGEGQEILLAGDLLAGQVDPNSVVLQNNFADAMAQIEDDLQGELVGDMTGFYLRAYAGQIPIIGNGCILSLQGDAEVAFWYWQLEGPSENFGGFLNPAVYGRVLCLVDARGDVYLRYQQADGVETFTGEGYLAGGVGKCDPASWGSWEDRWWDDGGCLQAGAGLAVDYSDASGWSVDYAADYERLFE